MSRPGRYTHERSPALFGVLVLLLVARPAPAEVWKFDVVHLKNGRSLQGLVVRETPAEIVFKRITRKPGTASTSTTSCSIRMREPSAAAAGGRRA